MEKLWFGSDYQEGCDPSILRALEATNYDKTPGYGLDPVCERAKAKIRAACRAEDAEVWFLSGGTQTNATVIAGALRGYEAVIAAQTGHIHGHEAGAIELGGHKVLTLPDMAQLCDIFYIGGTKCGALLGEAIVARPGLLPHFFTVIKQHGGLMAKGRLMGLQFDCLFEGDRYAALGRHANALAARLRKTLLEKGYTLTVPSPTNQIFVTVDNERLARLGERVVYGFWEQADETHTVIRLATSWATTEEEIAALEALL